MLCLLAAAALAVLPAMARPHKLRVSDAAQAAALKAHGARLLADYGSFQLLETDDAKAAALQVDRVEAVDDSNFIELNAGPLDTLAPAVQAQRKAIAPAAGRRLHLVQFVGPIKPEWHEALAGTGIQVVHYLPQNAYLICGDSAALVSFQAWAAANPLVQWEGDYAADYRIHPKARTVDAQGNPQTPATDAFTVQLLQDAAANPGTLALIDQLKLAAIEQQFQTLDYLNVVVRLPASRLSELAARPDVVSIQTHPKRHMMDERQDQIMAGNLSGNVPSGAGYLAWLASKGFTQAQFAASGLVVDVSDSGIDNGTTSPGHFGLYRAGDPGQGARVAYARREGTANTGSTLQGCDGHGNLNSHIIAGFNSRATGFPHTDASGYHYGLGVCPFVKVGSSVIFDPSSFTSPSYPDLQSRAYRDGARVSNNSWGADTAGDYDADAQSYDSLVRDAQPTSAAVPTTGNQQMVIVFAAGNAGPSATTVGSPGTAKNVLVVGAAENVHSHSATNGGNNTAGNDGCTTPDTEADSANDMSSFSSRGPCADGRKKPDIVAPGTHITGGVAQSVLTTNGTGTAISCFSAEGVCALPGGGTVGSSSNFFPVGQQFYSTSSGTSHSTPAIAGACALLRQYFLNSSLTPPSPAMTKAFLVNAARYMTGTYAGDTLPSSVQGMGAVNLGTAFDGVARVLRDQVTEDKFTSSGQTRVISGNVVDTSKPFRVTLAWTDAPGSTTGNAYNNNLDLTVTVNGIAYKGNVFSGSTSVTGGTADAKNNLESVFLPAGVSGSFAVTVTAANINSDGVPNESPTLDQDYALVIYNGAETSAPVISTDPQSQTVALGSPATFSAAAFGQAPIGFQWRFNGSPIADATDTSYTIDSAQTTNAGSYSVVATNSYGSATSAVATLTVAVAPIIVANPANLTVVTGSTAGFTVTALGAAPLGYQWQFNGGDIANATASAYTITGVQLGDQGSYGVVVSNYAGSVTSAPASLTVYAWSATGVVISQIYGGGGNSGATYRNDYVELFNAGAAEVNLGAWSVQYASSSGSTWSKANLTGTVQPGAYYLLQLASGGANGVLLPPANATNTGINISGSNGKLALVTNQTVLSGSNPVGTATIKDFVGFGSANAYAGTGTAPAGNATNAILRKDNGMTDTANNAADFLAGTPNPRSSVINTGTIDLSITKTHAGSFLRGDTADTYTITVANAGSLATTGMVTVVDSLPAGLTATALSGSGWTTNLGTLTCTRSDALAAGSSYPAITLTVGVATNAPSSVTNVASVSTGGDTNTANNTVSDNTTIGGTIDLAVTKTHTGSFTKGDPADVYTITVTNAGALATTGAVTVIDTLPAGLTATTLSGTGWTTTLGTLTCTRSDALSARSVYPAITLTVSVATNAPSQVTNVVSVSTGGDGVATNNTASDVTTILTPNTGGGISYTGILAGWDVTGQNNFGVSPLAPTTYAPNLTVGSLTRGAGVTASGSASANAWGGKDFATTSPSAAESAGDYASFSVSVNAGYKVSFASVSRFDYRRSGTGPTNGVIEYQVGSGAFVSFVTNTYTATASSGGSLNPIALSGVGALQNVGAGTNINFRIVNYNGATDGTWYILNVAANTDPDFALSGTVTSLAGPPAAAPMLSLVSVVTNQLQFTLTGTAGSNYVIEAATNLPASAWTPVRTGAAPITYSQPVTNSQRYYRGNVWP
jgi:uncharacterized repeat protein (TIGR01451 family)